MRDGAAALLSLIKNVGLNWHYITDFGQGKSCLEQSSDENFAKGSIFDYNDLKIVDVLLF